MEKGNDVIVVIVAVLRSPQVMENRGGAACLEQNRYICLHLLVSIQMTVILNSNQKTSTATRNKPRSGPSPKASAEDAESMSSLVAKLKRPPLS